MLYTPVHIKWWNSLLPQQKNQALLKIGKPLRIPANATDNEIREAYKLMKHNEKAMDWFSSRFYHKKLKI